MLAPPVRYRKGWCSVACLSCNSFLRCLRTTQKNCSVMNRAFFCLYWRHLREVTLLRSINSSYPYNIPGSHKTGDSFFLGVGQKTKGLHKESFCFMEVRGVEPLSKIPSMHVPTSFPFGFKISLHPRPRRSAQASASLVNLGIRPQAWRIPIPYCVRTFASMGAERGPALPLIRQRVRSFR